MKFRLKRILFCAGLSSYQLRTPLRKATKARKAMREPAMLPTRKTAWWCRFGLCFEVWMDSDFFGDRDMKYESLDWWCRFAIVMTIDGHNLGDCDVNGWQWWQWWWWSWWRTWTWLAPLDAASRMFASSLFCEWGRILTPIFSIIRNHKVLFMFYNIHPRYFFRNTVGCQFLIFLMSNLGGKVLSLGAWLLGLWIEELAERWLSSWQYKQG